MGKQSFGTLNWLVLIVYLIVMLLIGLSFSKKKFEELTRIFFKATESKVPAWAVGFSIFATTLSAITYMSTPEKSFLTDWAYGFGNLAIFFNCPSSD